MAIPLQIVMLFRVMCTVLVVVNIIGNALIIRSVQRFPFMRTPMNFLIVHLAVCDMLVGILLIPRTILQGLYQHPSGSAGDLLCKFLTIGTFGWLFSCASVYTLVAIAWERYNAIVKPHSPRFTNKKIKIAISTAWILGLLVCLPGLVASAYDPRSKHCDYKWKRNWAKQFDAVLWLLAVFVVPASVVVVLYGRVIQTLWFSTNRVTNIAMRSLQKSRMRITKVILTVTLIFFMCWLPHLLFYTVIAFLSNTSTGKLRDPRYAAVVYKLSHTLILFNSSINPFIYAYHDVRFRRCMGNILGRGKTSSSEDENGTHRGLQRDNTAKISELRP